MYPRRPNILCFVTDQQRADHMGCAGNPDLRTPNIDWIAQTGIRLANSYVANPVCMPNRASLFTGLYPQAHGLRENGQALLPQQQTLMDLLRAHGYQTASFGKLHLAPFGISGPKARAEFETYESREYWGSRDAIPVPYYGFEQVYLVGGHGDFSFGSYRNELDRLHPGAWQLLGRGRAASEPTGARESWKASIPEELHYNSIIADKTIEYIGRRDTYHPFFVWCSFPDPHHPYSPPRPYCDQYDPAALGFHPARRDGELEELPWYCKRAHEGRIRVTGLKGDLRAVTEEHYREILAHTYGMISMVDHHIGRVIEAVRRRGQLEETIIVFLSDHGDLMGDHWLLNKGPFFFDGLLKVPTIWRLPGSERPGTECASLVSAVDFCPTVLDLAGVPIPATVQGRSYRTLLAGEAESIRDELYIEFDDDFVEERLRSIRTPEWALTYHVAKDYGMLFDLKSDPHELHNLWNRPEHRQIRTELLLRLLDQTTRAAPWSERRSNA